MRPDRSYINWIWYVNLSIFLAITVFYISFNAPSFLIGSYWQIESKYWIYLALFIPIVHQLYVAIVWHLQLNYKSISNLFGKQGFLVYKIVFLLLLALNLVSITILSLSNCNSIELSSLTKLILSSVLLTAAAYLWYSLIKYFGIDQAVGIDHFEPELARKKGMVNKGIFKYINNSMYVVGLSILYLPAIVLESKSGLLLAFFNHLYIWVHYFLIEKPDIQKIYLDSSIDTEAKAL